MPSLQETLDGWGATAREKRIAAEYVADVLRLGTATEGLFSAAAYSRHLSQFSNGIAHVRAQVIRSW